MATNIPSSPLQAPCTVSRFAGYRASRGLSNGVNLRKGEG